MAVCGIALHAQRAGAAAAIGGSAGAGSRVARRASMKRGRRPLPASRRDRACASSKSPRSAGAVWPWQRRADHQIDTGQPAVGIQRAGQRLGRKIEVTVAACAWALAGNNGSGLAQASDRARTRGRWHSIGGSRADAERRHPG
jgi:hypothetical protein